MKRLIPLVFGMLFGLALWKAKATDPSVMREFFLFRDFHIAGVMGAAFATTFLGFLLVRRYLPRSLTGEPMKLTPPPHRPRVFLFGLVFGVGWALTGACPGPAFTALGEGRGQVLLVIAGMIVGTWIWGRCGGDLPREVGA